MKISQETMLPFGVAIIMILQRFDVINAFLYVQKTMPTISLSGDPLRMSSSAPKYSSSAKAVTTRQNRTCIRSSIGTNDDSKLPMNPSSKFGRPLNESTVSFNKFAIAFIKSSLFDSIFDTNPNIIDQEHRLSRSFARFYALETIARMPYFSYLSVLHLYETLGWWRRADYLKMHFCESWNELHHLLIMEELGGSQKWFDRFVAQHAAFFYYWFVVACYMFNPTLAYNLNQQVESHAYDTYDEFLNEFEVILKSRDSPEIAKKYYRDGDLYLFDEMHSCPELPTSQVDDVTKVDLEAKVLHRRPKVDTLYDVFVAIREDEKEHMKTMEYFQSQDADIDLCSM